MIGYCTIQEAAEISGYSVEKIVSLGANELISIGLVVGEGVAILQRIEKGTGEIIEEKAGIFPGHTVKVSSKCLKQAEANVKSAEIILGCLFGKPEQPIEIIKIMDLDTDKPLLVKDARLIVFDEDLAILKGLGKLDTLPGKTNTNSTRENQLHSLIWRVRQSVSKDGRVNANRVWNELQKNYPAYDTDEIIQEVTAKEILWVSTYGTEQRFKRTGLNSLITRLKKNPPI